MFGQFNIADASTAGSYMIGDYVEIVGNGKQVQDPDTGEWTIVHSNARTLDWNGNQYIAGIQTDINGIQSIRDITLVDYEALTPAEQENGVAYNVYDDDGTYGDYTIFEISRQYDNTATYDVGDYCIYDFKLYKCDTAVTTAEDFDNTKWTLVKVMEEVDNAKQDITVLQSRANNYIKAKMISVRCADMTTGMDLSSYVTLDTGYKFFCWQTLGFSNGWISDFPIYISNPLYASGLPFWRGTLSSAYSVNFIFFEIRDNI